MNTEEHAMGKPCPFFDYNKHALNTEELGELSLTNAAYAKEIVESAARYGSIERAIKEEASKKIIDQVMTQIRETRPTKQK